MATLSSATPTLETPRDTDLESSLNISFVAPTTEQLAELDDLVGRMAARAGCSKPTVWSPAAGVLAAPMSTEVRKSVNEALGPIYAKHQVAFQEGVKRVAIQETRERMVDLEVRLQEGGFEFSRTDVPFPDFAGEWGGKPRVFWVREGMATRLDTLANVLNHVGLAPHFLDGFRPAGVQEGYFREFYRRTGENPSLEPCERLEETKSKIACAPYLAARQFGAAVDLFLKDRTTGTILDVGNGWPDGGAVVALNFPYVTWSQYRARQLFRHACEISGLVIYPGEDWHTSYGDGFATMLNGKRETLYGPISGFDRESGEVWPVSPEVHYQQFDKGERDWPEMVGSFI